MLRDDDQNPAQPASPADAPARATPEGREPSGPSPARRPEPAGPQPAEARPEPPKVETPSEDERTRWQKLRDFVKAHPVAVAIGAVLLIGAAIAATLWYLEARHWESTDDAFVDGRAFAIAPKVSGYLVEVGVTDNEHVEAGAAIARVDDADYQVALRQAEGQVAGAQASVEGYSAQITAQEAQIEEARAAVTQSQAALQFASDESRRASRLVETGSGTVQRAQQTASDLTQSQANVTKSEATLHAAEQQVAVLRAQRDGARAQLAQAEAQRDQARLNLGYTKVVAAQAGRIARLTGAKGQLVQAGTALAMLVPDRLWVTANFKETQLADMRPGQEVRMRIDAYPGRALRGRVDSIQPGSGTAFSLLPAQNATGNYVKVVQRVPVKLVFDEVPQDVVIGPGMSVVPDIRVR